MFTNAHSYSPGRFLCGKAKMLRTGNAAYDCTLTKRLAIRSPVGGHCPRPQYAWVGAGEDRDLRPERRRACGSRHAVRTLAGPAGRASAPRQTAYLWRTECRSLLQL